MDVVLDCHFDNSCIKSTSCHTNNKLLTPKSHIDIQINFKDLNLISHDAHTQTHDGDLNPCLSQKK
jgi:hypothetical protein